MTDLETSNEQEMNTCTVAVMEISAELKKFEAFQSELLAQLRAQSELKSAEEIQEMAAAVAKECEEIGMAVYNLVAAFKKASEDGLSVTDIPEIAMVTVQELFKAINGFQKIPGEFSADFSGALMAILKPILEAIKLLLKK